MSTRRICTIAWPDGTPESAALRTTWGAYPTSRRHRIVVWLRRRDKCVQLVSGSVEASAFEAADEEEQPPAGSSAMEERGVVGRTAEEAAARDAAAR